MDDTQDISVDDTEDAIDVRRPLDSGWMDIRAGIGDEWDFKTHGPMIGSFIGGTPVTTDDVETGEPRTSMAWQFACDEHDGMPEGVFFVWGSYNMDAAMNQPDVFPGALMRVSYLGKAEIKNGKQTVKRYRVQVWKGGR